jgi:pimeloyl-ACP methyl ester carboxylesterase
MLKPIKTDVDLGPAKWLSGGQGDTTLLFAPANGFPAGSYQSFLAYFQNDFSLIGIENRGAWDNSTPSKHFSWRQHADDLIRFLDQHQASLAQRPVIAMGHSIGATISAIAAAKRPDLFKALLMFDPAAIPGRFLPTLAAIAPTELMGQLNLVKRTQNRRQLWPDRQTFIDYHRHKAAYRRFSDQAFRDYAQFGLVEQPDGQFKLRYSRDWEAHNFKHTSSPWLALRNIQIPTLILRAEHSYLHKQKEFERRVKRLPALVSHGTIHGAGHMALQEDCEQVVQLSRDWLAKNNLLRTAS